MKISVSIAALPVIAAMISSLACGPKVPQQSVRERPTYQSATPEELLGSLMERNKGIDGLRGKGRLEFRLRYKTRDYRGADINFSYHKPNKVYARGKAGVAGDVFILKSDGKRYYAENKRDRIVYTGSVEERGSLHVDSDIWEGLNPVVLAQALLLDDFGDYRVVCVTLPDLYIIDLLKDTGGTLSIRRRIWFEREHLRVQRHQVFSDNGEIMTDAFLFKYKDIGGVEIPTLYRIERHWQELSLLFELSEIKLNPAYNEKLYRYSIPAGFEVREIDGRKENAEPGQI